MVTVFINNRHYSCWKSLDRGLG